MRRENQLLAIYLSLIYLTNNAEGLSILHLRPPPLWAILNYELTNASFFKDVSTEAAQCKMTCFVLPQCSYAQTGQIGSVDQCQIGTADNSLVYQLIPHAGSMVIFNPNGYGLYDPPACTANKFLHFPDDIIQVSETTKLYYSLRDPENIYWILNKHMGRAEAIGNCSSFSNTTLAYFMNLPQMEIGIFILFAENSTLTLDQYNQRPTFHVDMNTQPSIISSSTTWPLVVGRQRTVIPATVFSSDPRFQISPYWKKKLKEELHILVIYLSLVVICKTAKAFSILYLKPTLLWAVQNYAITNGAFQNSEYASTIAQCKMTCCVLPRCSNAQIELNGSLNQCQMGITNNSKIYKLSPQVLSIVIFNPNGFGLYDPTNGTASKFVTLPREIIKVSETTKLYSSPRDPEHIYWILNKPMVRAEAIGNCSRFANTTLAYFMNLPQMEIGIFILFAENSTLTRDQYVQRPTFHVDMNTQPNSKESTTWPLVVGRQGTLIPATVFSSDPRFQVNGLLTGTDTLYIQWMGGPTLNDHYDDDNVAALCCTRVFGFTD